MADGGLGTSLVGEKIVINSKSVAVMRLIGEGGFSYVYLVKELADTNSGQTLHNSAHGESSGAEPTKSQQRRAGSASGGTAPEKPLLVLKVTSIHSRSQRDIAEKEAKLLSRLSHPSIIKMFDTCYRQVGSSGGGGFLMKETSTAKPQHIILMEYCEGGHALDVCNKLSAAGKRFDLSTLIIAFGQICNAVSYLHAQRPPIVHRDLKPVNFLVKNGAYKLCDFGSAVFGHVDLRTQKARADAEEVIEKTTTQMFRAPEMVDLFSAKRLTQATDVWALGACLYSLAFLQNCFEEGSNLAILSRKYKIPEDNPYGDGLVELLDRMLTVDAKARSDMTEVILCLSAVYSGRPLPPRKKPTKSKKDGEKEGDDSKRPKSKERSISTAESKTKAGEKKKKDGKIAAAGTFKTGGAIHDGLGPSEKKEAKKLNPNSAAARRRQAAGGTAPNGQGTSEMEFSNFDEQFDKNANQQQGVNQDEAFSTNANPFAGVTSESGGDGAAFDAFENTGNNTPSTATAFAADFGGAEWGEAEPDKANRSHSAPDDAFAKFDSAGAERSEERSPPRRAASGKTDKDKHRSRRPRRKSATTGEDSADGLDASFSGMQVDGETRKPRRDRSGGKDRSRSGGKEREAHARNSGTERQRRPKEAEEGDKGTPRRNRSSRESARTSG